MQNGAALAAEIGLAYAILRRRIFDFGLAVNPRLSSASSARSCSSHSRSRTVSTASSSPSTTRENHPVERHPRRRGLPSVQSGEEGRRKGVDHLFFGRWAANDDDLRGFVEQANTRLTPMCSRSCSSRARPVQQGPGCVLFQRRDATFCAPKRRSPHASRGRWQ